MCNFYLTRFTAQGRGEKKLAQIYSRLQPHRKNRRKQLTCITQVEIHHILQSQLPVTDRIHTQDTRAIAQHVSSLRQHQSKAQRGTKSKSGTKATSLHPKVDTSKWHLDTPCKTAHCLPNVGNLLLLKLAIKMIKRGL